MNFIRPLPQQFVQRFLGWRATRYAENKEWYQHLDEHGQNPRSMMISCCDSRIKVNDIFGADSGEIFLHRNIANFVPPYVEDGGVHGTSAAIEYGVNVLKVVNLIVVGHSKCGGVEGAYHHHHGELKMENTFLSPWLEMMNKGLEKLPKTDEDIHDILPDLEKQNVLTSLSNLYEFPFIREKVEAGQLALHGLWHDIAEGNLYQYSAETGRFEPLDNG